MKRILLAGVVVLMNLTGAARSISEETFTLDGLKYAEFGRVVAGVASKDVTKVVVPSVVKYGGGEAEVVEISEAAFRDCPKLESITIGGSVTDFSAEVWGGEASYPFSGTPSLKEIIIEEGEEGIRLPYPFVDEDWNLESLVINRQFFSNKIVNEGDGKYHWEDNPVFEGIKVEKVELHFTMDALPDKVFRKSAINTLVVGSGISSLGANTFQEMQEPIKQLIAEASESPLQLYREVVTSVTGSGGIGSFLTNYYPSFDASAYEGMQEVNMGRLFKLLNETKLYKTVSSLTIGGDIKEIGEQEFANSESLESVVIGEGIETIGYGAFAQCHALREVYLPTTLKVVSDQLFAECESLTVIEIPSGVTKIGSAAFAGSGLTSLTIPESVEEIDVMAFADCPLTSVRVFRETPLVGDEYSMTWFSCYDTAKLIVPKTAIEAYKETSPWSLFKNIVSEPWIKCTPAELVFTVGEKKTLEFEVMDPDDSFGWTIFCESLDPEIFTINPDTFELTALKEGIAELTVAAMGSWNVIKATFTVRVTADAAVDVIAVDPDEVVTVYNMKGVKVGNFKYSDLNLNLSTGIYIVRTSDGRSEKFILR